MKKILFFTLFILISGMTLNGCATWQGVKKDSQRMWHVIIS